MSWRTMVPLRDTSCLLPIIQIDHKMILRQFPLDFTFYFSDGVRIIYVSESFSCSSLIAAEILPDKPN